MTRCENCIYGMKAKPRTEQEETAERRIRAQRFPLIDENEPLPERAGSCHLHPPRAEMIPTPTGPMNVSLWPSLVFSEEGACCADGQPKIDLN